MRSNKDWAWFSYENWMSCEGEWPRIQHKNTDTYMRLRNRAMKRAFMAGWTAAKIDARKKKINKRLFS